MKVLIILTILSGIAIAERQQRFECVGDNGETCECVYDKKGGGKLSIYCRQRTRELDYKPRYSGTSLMDGSDRKNHKGYRRFGLSERSRGVIVD